MSKRREFLKSAGALSAASALFQQMGVAAGAKLNDTVVDASNATASKINGQDLKIHFEGPTDQLKSMTSGSLVLQPPQDVRLRHVALAAAVDGLDRRLGLQLGVPLLPVLRVAAPQL